GDCEIDEVDEFQVMKLGNRTHDLVRRGVVQFGQSVLDFDAGLVGQRTGLFELVRAENVLAEEDVGEVTARLGHDWQSPNAEESMFRGGMRFEKDSRNDLSARQCRLGNRIGGPRMRDCGNNYR